MAAFVTSIGAQCVKMSPVEHVTCVIEYCYFKSNKQQGLIMLYE